MPERPADETADQQEPVTDAPPGRRRGRRADPGEPREQAEPATGLVPVMAGEAEDAGTDAPMLESGQDAADEVVADVVSIAQGGVQSAHARHVDVTQGGIWHAEASDVAVSMGGIGVARGDTVSVEMGAAGIALARDVRISQAFAREVIAREVEVEQAAIGTLVTARARFARRGLVGILIARDVEGDVRALLDWRGALALGAALGVVIGLLRRR